MVNIARLSSVASVGVPGASLASKAYKPSVPSKFDSANPAAQTYNVPARTTGLQPSKLWQLVLTASSLSSNLSNFNRPPACFVGYHDLFCHLQ